MRIYSFECSCARSCFVTPVPPSSDLPNIIRSIMGMFRTLLLSASAAGFVGASLSPRISDPSQACAALKQNYPNTTLLPEDEGYKGENEGTFVQIQNPLCPHS